MTRAPMTLAELESVVWLNARLLADGSRDERDAGMAAVLAAAERYRIDGCPDPEETVAAAELVRRRAREAHRDWPEKTAERLHVIACTVYPSTTAGSRRPVTAGDRTAEGAAS